MHEASDEDLNGQKDKASAQATYATIWGSHIHSFSREDEWMMDDFAA